MCFVDCDRQMALSRWRGGIVGVGRLTKLTGTGEAEMAFIVRDAFQNRDLGGEILRRLIEFARSEDLLKLRASVLAINRVYTEASRTSRV